MPLYSYRCCDRSQDAFNSVDARDTGAPACGECGQPMARQLSAPMVQVPGGDVSYKCSMTGEVVKSMRRRRYLMEKEGVVDARDFKDQWARTDAARKAEKAEAKAYYDSLPQAVKDAAKATAPTA